MRAYIIRRLLLLIPTLFLASFAIFLMMRLLPGDIVDMLLSGLQVRDVELTRADLLHELGLDVPGYIQYGRWIGNIFMHGDLGTSLWTKVPVSQTILESLPVTLELGSIGLIVGLLIAVPVGIFSALRQDTWGDYISRSFAILCIAVPGFWLGTMIIVFPSIWWGYTPSILVVPFFEDPIGNLKMFIVPGVLVGMAMAGLTMRMTRTMMLEVLREDYIRTAWAKGLSERVVVIRHALKNALIPVVTIVGLAVPTLIGGTVIVEQIFCLPGVGHLIVSATTKRDYTLVSGVMLFLGLVVMLVNLVVDITYGYLDPRIRYR